MYCLFYLYKCLQASSLKPYIAALCKYVCIMYVCKYVSFLRYKMAAGRIDQTGNACYVTVYKQ